MTWPIVVDPAHIRVDADGAVRVGDTRVLLASIVYRHQQGDTPEEIHEGFPGVPLADIYAAIAYYLRHRAEVDSHLAGLGVEAERLQREVEAEYGLPEELRERLRARLRERQGEA
jgi:uncharacterized protein (DUF433 family)